LFPLKSLEIFKENSTRYELASNYAHGRIFDSSPGAFMSYHSTKILFKNGISEEIINENAFEENPIYTRRIKTKDNSIDFSIISHNFLKNESFDTVISFDTIQFQNNFDDYIKNFFNLLKTGGNFILSVPNSNRHSDLKNVFTEQSIKLLLQKYFKNTKIYYQKKSIDLDSNLLLQSTSTQKNHSNTSLKKIIRKLYSLVDKNFNFYELYLKKVYLKFFPPIITKKQDFVPVDNSDGNDYDYFVIVCKK
tara:strand:- start:15707 stop:16453 length:747 start_codon:yes stop_codon:yes gene_type:complete